MTVDMPDTRTPFYFMGVEIGTATGWVAPDRYSILLRAFIPNAVGQKFLGCYEPPYTEFDLNMDFDTGAVSVYDTEGNETQFNADWSVFNGKRLPEYRAIPSD